MHGSVKRFYAVNNPPTTALNSMLVDFNQMKSNCYHLKKNNLFNLIHINNKMTINSISWNINLNNSVSLDE